MAMTSNSARQPSGQSHALPMQFNEAMNHNQGMQQGNIQNPTVMPGANMNFLQPNAMPLADNQQMKSLHQANMPPPNTIPLATLIDFVVYKTYHDITVMADILPSKNDLERKTTIVEFSARTRQLFVRLFSLVKWASSVGKVGRCSEGSAFLDRQALLFVDTADKLHILANQLVVQARLPNFSVPAAVDVLTTGTYPRLPLCIRDRIIPPDPIKPKEQKAALKRIDQIILYRLVLEEVPPQIMEVKVEHGVVHLLVPNEFKAYLTLMGDKETVPWRVLKLEFLVDDLDVGTGRSLIHHLQVDYIHELVQSRLVNNERPLKDLYNLLHSFCLSLQLEVLHEQADRLRRLRWGNFIHLDEYAPGQKMSVSYWRYHPFKNEATPFTITIRQSPNNSSKPLQVLHSPKLSLADIGLAESCSHVHDLSLEHLIHRSICTRSYHLLNEIKEMLSKHIRHDSSHFSTEESDKHSVLYIPLLDPSRESECLRLLVDPQTGSLQPFVDDVSDAMLEKMEKEINESQPNLLRWFMTLRCELAKQRCRRAVQHFPVLCMDQLLLSESSHTFSDSCLFVKILHHPSYYLIIEMVAKADRPTRIAYRYRLLSTSTIQTKPLDGSAVKSELHVASVHDLEAKLTLSDVNFTEAKKDRVSRPGSLEKNEVEVQHMVSVCCSHIPLVNLIKSMDNAGVEHQGVMEGGLGYNAGCSVVSLPDIPDLSSDVNGLLKDSLLQCSFRLLGRADKVWTAELLMKESFIKGDVTKLNGVAVPVTFNYDASSHTHQSVNKNVMKLFLDDWAAMGKLFSAALVFSEQMKHPSMAYSLGSSVKVHSYKYKSITVRYGKAFSQFVAITWLPEKKFQLRFGRTGLHASSNAHCLIRQYLTEQFNASPDISALMQTLHDTSSPLQSLARLPITPLLGVYQKATSVEQTFTVVAQTAMHVRVTFLSAYCIDIYFRGDGSVMVRDGAFSQFDYAKSKNSLIPIPGLAAFLSKYKDSRYIRRHANTEKDNPPSPAAAQRSGPQNYGLQDLPYASYSAASFTVLPHSSLVVLCAPCPPPPNANRPSYAHQHVPSPLEQFLGAALTRRFLNKCISNTDNVSNIPMAQETADGADGSLASAFVARSLQVVCQPHPQDMRRLILKVRPAALANQTMENWSPEDLHILERFFEVRITCSPYRYNAMRSFFSMISAPAPILKDLIQLMRIELSGARPQGFPVKWTMSLCLTSPPRVTIAPIGTPCIIVKDKVLVFIQLTQVVPPQMNQGNPQTIIVPLLYEPPKNMVNILPPALAPNTPAAQTLKYIANLLTRLADTNRQSGQSETTFSIAVRYLMETLTLTN